MARADTIGRLHQPAPQPEREQVKVKKFLNSEPDVAAPSPERTVRARWALTREEPVTYNTLDAPTAIMSTCAAACALDRSRDFAVLGLNARVQSWLAQRAMREGGAPPGAMQNFLLYG